MATASLADYQVLQDGHTTLSRVNGDSFPNALDLTFFWPSNLIMSNASRRQILSMKVNPDTDIRFSVFLDGHFLINEINLNSSHTRAYHEVVDVNRVIQSGVTPSGTVPFRINMLEGRGWFSDIILWYQIEHDV